MVYGAALERRFTERYRGFKSLTLRQNSESEETDKVGSRLRRDPVFAPETHSEILRCVLYKVRMYFESNPDAD